MPYQLSTLIVALLLPLLLKAEERPVYIGDKPNLYYASKACADYLVDANNRVRAHGQPLEPTLLERAKSSIAIGGTMIDGLARHQGHIDISQDSDAFLQELIESYRPSTFLRIKDTGLEAARHAQDFPAAPVAKIKKLDTMQETMVAEVGVFKEALYTVHSTYFLRKDDPGGRISIGATKEALADGKSVTLRLDGIGSLAKGRDHLKALIKWYQDNKDSLPKMRDAFDPSKRGTVTPELNIVVFAPLINLKAIAGNFGRLIPNTPYLVKNLLASLYNRFSSDVLSLIISGEEMGFRFQMEEMPMDWNNMSPAHNSHDKYTVADLAWPEHVRILQRTGNDAGKYRMDPTSVDENGTPITHHDFAYLYENLPNASDRPKEMDVGFQLRRKENWLNSHHGNSVIKESLWRKFKRGLLTPESAYSEDRTGNKVATDNWKKISEIDSDYYDHLNNYLDGIEQVAMGSGMTDVHAPGFFSRYFSQGWEPASGLDLSSNYANVGRLFPQEDLHNADYRARNRDVRAEKNAITSKLIRLLESEHVGVVDFTPYPRFHPKYIHILRTKLALDPQFTWTLVGDHWLTNNQWVVQIFFEDRIWEEIVRPYGTTEEEKAILRANGIRTPSLHIADQIKWYKYGRKRADKRFNPEAQFLYGLNHAKAQVLLGQRKVTITSSNRDQLSLTRNSEVAFTFGEIEIRNHQVVGPPELVAELEAAGNPDFDFSEFVDENGNYTSSHTDRFMEDARRDLIEHSVLHGSAEDRAIEEYARSLSDEECIALFGSLKCRALWDSERGKWLDREFFLKLLETRAGRSVL